MARQPRAVHRRAPKGAFTIALFYLLTRERVDVLFDWQLVFCMIFLQLISDVLFYYSLISSYRTHIVPSAPEMSIAIFVLHAGILLKDH